MDLYHRLKRSAEKWPQNPAIFYGDAEWSYTQLLRHTNALGKLLANRGVGPGTFVALLLPNVPLAVSAYYGITSLGAICTPANPLLKATELLHMWNDADSSLVITIPALLPVVSEVVGERPGMKALVSGPVPTGIKWAASMDAELSESSRIFNPPNINEHEPAVCIYTSGTTGHPKGALLSHRNLLCNVDQIMDALQLGRTDRFLCVLPLFHSFAATVCQNTPLACGGATVLLDSFTPTKLLEAVKQRQVTILPAVPAIYTALLASATVDKAALASVRFCVSGGAPMPAATMTEFENRFNTIILEGDGPTECSPVTSVNPPNGPRKPGSVGPPLPGVEVAIFSDTDSPVRIGQTGEIVVRGDNVMLGYHNQPKETAEAMRGGWYHTGDLGRVDEDGYIYIVDRKKDMLIVAGLNVYPREVEETLLLHPGVADAAVVGLPDPLRGDMVIAVVVLQNSAQPSEHELIGWCRERLANYKVPRHVLIRPALPRGATGKVVKRLLKKELELESLFPARPATRRKSKETSP